MTGRHILAEQPNQTMKVPDSGMPPEDYWNSLFDHAAIWDWLATDQLCHPIVEIGCGYGSFTRPLVQQQSQAVYAFDIEAPLIEQLRRRLEQRATPAPYQLDCRDVINHGTGLPRASAGLVLLFNLLHSEHNAALLAEAIDLLAPAGRVAILHWRKDIPTPRGPEPRLRPDLNQLQEILASCPGAAAGELRWCHHREQLGPYHWGVQLQRPPV